MHQKLHNDGDFVIYKVEALRHYSSGPAWQSWEVMYHDETPPVPTIPVRYANKEDRVRHREKEPFRSWSANGECWQATGIDGFFDRAKADLLVELLLKHNPEDQFRIIEQTISQHTRIVLTVQGKGSGKGQLATA